MCGIAGEVRFDGQAPDVFALQRCCAAMSARGPDGSGLWAQGAVAFGHRRLAIIDLSVAGSQPMVDPALGLTLVLNGCICNHAELRAELSGAGHRFFSQSDTEVVAKAYAQWGTDCVRRFHGMFAFAIAEHRSGRVVLARDRLGIKPLYLAESPGGLRFASTLPALLAAGGIDTSIDRVALACYMTFHSVVPAPRTILRGSASGAGHPCPPGGRRDRLRRRRRHRAPGAHRLERRWAQRTRDPPGCVGHPAHLRPAG